MPSVFNSQCQIIAAASNFDGGSPTNAAVFNDDFKVAVHASGTNGGYFLNPNSFATKIKRIIFNTATAVTTLQIYIASVNDTLHLLYSGSTVTDLVMGDVDGVIVLKGESLIFLTTGGTAEMRATVTWDADSDLVS